MVARGRAAIVLGVALMASAGAAYAAKPPTPIPIAANAFIDWDEDKDGPRTIYTVDGLKLEASAETVDEDRQPVLKVTAPNGKTVTARGAVGFSRALMRIGVGKLDPASPYSQVIMTSFTGGAHCCTDVIVLDYLGKGWKTVEVGEWDGEPLDPFPKDEDGDGVRDLVLVDQAFLYAFAAYAFSWAPPVVMNIRNGEVKDVSASGRYRRLHEARLAEMRKDCAEHNNGACAAMAAVAARLGRFQPLWSEVVANQDRSSDWTLPTACRRQIKGQPCPKDEVVVFAGFPEALRWFLGEHGYMPAVPLPPKKR